MVFGVFHPFARLVRRDRRVAVGMEGTPGNPVERECLAFGFRESAWVTVGLDGDFPIAVGVHGVGRWVGRGAVACVVR